MIDNHVALVASNGNVTPVYDPINRRFAVGDPSANRVSVFVAPALFADDFE